MGREKKPFDGFLEREEDKGTNASAQDIRLIRKSREEVTFATSLGLVANDHRHSGYAVLGRLGQKLTDVHLGLRICKKYFFVTDGFLSIRSAFSGRG